MIVFTKWLLVEGGSGRTRMHRAASNIRAAARAGAVGTRRRRRIVAAAESAFVAAVCSNARMTRASASGLLLDLSEHLRGMLGGAGDLLPVLADLAVGPDPDRRADHPDGLLAVERLLAVGAPALHRR